MRAAIRVPWCHFRCGVGRLAFMAMLAWSVGLSQGGAAGNETPAVAAPDITSLSNEWRRMEGRLKTAEEGMNQRRRESEAEVIRTFILASGLSNEVQRLSGRIVAAEERIDQSRRELAKAAKPSLWRWLGGVSLGTSLLCLLGLGLGWRHYWEHERKTRRSRYELRMQIENRLKALEHFVQNESACEGGSPGSPDTDHQAGAEITPLAREVAALRARLKLLESQPCQKAVEAVREPDLGMEVSMSATANSDSGLNGTSELVAGDSGPGAGLRLADLGAAYRLFCAQSDGAQSIAPVDFQNWLTDFFNLRLPVMPVYRDRVRCNAHDRPEYTTEPTDDPHAPAYWLVPESGLSAEAGEGAFLLPAFSSGERFVEVESAFVLANESIPTPQTIAALEPGLVRRNPEKQSQWILEKRGRLRSSTQDRLDEVGAVADRVRDAFVTFCRRQTSGPATHRLDDFEKELGQAGLRLRAREVFFWLTAGDQPVFVRERPEAGAAGYWLVKGAGLAGLLFPKVTDTGDGFAELRPERGFSAEGRDPCTPARLEAMTVCQVMKAEDADREWFQVAQKGRCVFQKRKGLW
jgi:hypothetical protein